MVMKCVNVLNAPEIMIMRPNDNGNKKRRGGGGK